LNGSNPSRTILCSIAAANWDFLWKVSSVGTLHLVRRVALNGFVFQWAELAYHRVKEMSARLTSRKTIVRGRLEFPPFVHESFYVAGDNVKRGNGIGGLVGPTGW
jgi:hypothetical protein